MNIIQRIIVKIKFISIDYKWKLILIYCKAWVVFRNVARSATITNYVISYCLLSISCNLVDNATS